MPWKFTSLDPTAVHPPERETFDDAFRDMYRYVKGLLDAGQMSWQVLETSIWIDTPDRIPLFFYDARDIACKSGLMEKLLKGE